jgi:MFS family permease
MGSPAEACAAPTRVRYVVVAALCLAVAIAYVHRNCVGVAEEEVRADLGLSKEQSGLLMSAFFVTYSLFQLPTGWLGGVWGARRTLTLFALVGAAAMGLGAWLIFFPLLVLTRLILGVAQAALLPCATAVVGQWLPATRRGLGSGLLGSFMSVGSVVCAIVTVELLYYLSWRELFVLYAVPGALWGLGFWLWFRDRPQDHPAVNAAELAVIGTATTHRAAEPREPTPWGRLALSPAMWCICIQQFFRASGYLFYTSWFTTFLREHYGVTRAAGVLTSLPLLGVVLGNLVGGTFSDWVLARTTSRRLARQGLAIGSVLACAVCFVLAVPLTEAVPAVLLISFGSFCAAMASPCGYAITIDMGGRHVATVFSLMNMSGNFGAMLFPAVVPLLPGVAEKDWTVVLWFVAGIYAAAAVFWGMLNPSGTVFDREVPARSDA